MLDQDLIEQLRTAFEKLTGTVTLTVANSAHADQEDLLSMLRDVASASEKIRLEQAGESPVPRVEVRRENETAAIVFRAVPGGHEFSSLVLAILHRDGKGKLPDTGIVERVRRLKGPVRLTTYMSLSCENCPEVVQALNLMATLHPDFQHETVDGGLAPNEIEALGIQGVPSVVHNGKLIHSGKAQFSELLTRLEEVVGTQAATATRELGLFDVVVVGGGPAGASAAIYSVRKGLKTAIVAERFGGQLQETKGIENMISVAYTEGSKLSAQLAEHVGQYPVQLFEHRRVRQITGDERQKRIELEGGESIDAKAVIIATGAKWRQLGIPGEKDFIGRGVAFCAHCDGPFYKGKRVVVVGGGNSGVEAAIDLAGIASHVTLLEYGEKLKADGVLVQKLQGLPNARIVTRAKSTQVLNNGTQVVGLEYQDQVTSELKQLEVDGVFVQIGLLPNSQFVKGLVELTPAGEIQVDTHGRTNVAGIYAAGDVTTLPFKQIVVAMGDGAKVALTVYTDRTHADARASATASA